MSVPKSRQEIVLFGCPHDISSSYRVGSRLGPAAIRHSLNEIEDYSPYLEGDLRDVHFSDAGDLGLANKNTGDALNLIKETTEKILEEDKIPFALGGNHLITLPVLQVINKKYKNIKILYLDAHCDLREEYLGNKLSHATVAKRLLDFVSPESLFQFGIRSGERKEFEFAGRHKIIYKFSRKSLTEVLKKIGNSPLYITMDLDVFDPGIFPGTGVPEPGGISFEEFIEFIKGLKKTRIVGLDVVELSPPCDPTEISSFLAATVVREMLILIGKRKK
ncbi:agmatinase [Candidatus Desantisbacteria bacterium CG1_02_38_46]|uniref:Agmatinase n=1 Tax=Candidatus Desantisbacteria bacterium CG1_02_38_46 TaxID=1817893 RepID=A0A1J4SHF0_9BACT|nr:MAG: agmatinase [Candidatus Desantisbacteria bacterium CG1_02_38_46]